MKLFTFIATLFILFVATIVSAQQEGPEYLLAGGGSSFTAPPGYMLASIDRVKSSDFLNYYNNQGLQDSGETFPNNNNNNHCLIISVKEGALAIGSQISPSFFGPFGTNQQLENTTQQLTSPIFFGTLNYGGRSQNSYLGPLSTKIVSELFTVPISSQRFSSFCDVNSGYYGLYVRAVYTISGNGQNFPSNANNNGNDMELASVTDLQSSNFIAQYNVQGLSVDTAAFTTAGINVDDQSAMCCIFFTADGYLELGTSFTLGPYIHNSNSGQCIQQKSLTSPVYFGVFPSGNYIGQLNSTAVKELNANYNDIPNNNGGACANAKNTLAIFKMPKPLTPPTPPDLGDCIEVDFRAAYFSEPKNLNCLSDRWRYVLKFNTTVDQIQMNSFDTCGFQVTMGGVEVLEYPSNSSVFVARIQSLSNCDGCSGWGWLPLNTGSEMSQMCQKSIGEFGWCRALIQTDKRMKCPPFPPGQNYLKLLVDNDK